MGQVPLGLRLDEDLLSRIDVARKDVPRARWITRACEAALPPVEPVIPEPPAVEQAPGEVKEPPTREPSDSGLRTPGGDRSAAPAEQPPRFDELRPMSAEELRRFGARSSSFAKRDVRPVPKKGA